MAVADILTGMVVDVSDLLYKATVNGELVMFEGAQGTLLDIDHGTYPYVTSSNTTAGGVATGSGLGPRYVDYVRVSSKLTQPAWVPVRSRPNCLMKPVNTCVPKAGVRCDHRTQPPLRLAGHHCYPPRCADQLPVRVLHDQAGCAGWSERSESVCRLPFTEW